MVALPMWAERGGGGSSPGDPDTGFEGEAAPSRSELQIRAADHAQPTPAMSSPRLRSRVIVLRLATSATRGSSSHLVGVIDWEFSLAGSPLNDIANFFRHSASQPPEYEAGFAEGYLAAGGALPDDWKQLARLIEMATAAAGAADVAASVSFTLGSAETLPAADASADLVWCKEVLMFVDLDRACSEFARVRRPLRSSSSERAGCPGAVASASAGASGHYPVPRRTPSL